jgi:hypothetical protein
MNTKKLYTISLSVFLLSAIFFGFLFDYSFKNYIGFSTGILFIITLVISSRANSSKKLFKHSFLGLLIFLTGYFARPSTAYERKHIFTYMYKRLTSTFIIRIQHEVNSLPNHLDFIMALLNEQSINESYKKDNDKILSANSGSIDYSGWFSKDGTPVVQVKVTGIKDSKLIDQILGIIESSTVRTGKLQAMSDKSIQNLLKNMAIKQQMGEGESIMLPSPDFILDIELTKTRTDLGYRGRSTLQNANSGTILSSLTFYGKDQGEVFSLLKSISPAMFQK